MLIHAVKKYCKHQVKTSAEKPLWIYQTGPVIMALTTIKMGLRNFRKVNIFLDKRLSSEMSLMYNSNTGMSFKR